MLAESDEKAGPRGFKTFCSKGLPGASKDLSWPEISEKSLKGRDSYVLLAFT